jgi:ABC-type multidrug transport system fused ATPase/permease subunit
LELKELSFSYGNKQVLHRLSLTIRRGERVGIVGVSGAGKSTLFKLLLKEHENYEGQILLGGVPLRHISRDELFSHSAVVLQDTEVFHFTLRDNITLANLPHAKDEALLEKALQVAHVTDFLPRMPEGVETYIGEKGIKLSGGEKQRVGIARAIFKQPEILFLDEATSHLDVESEEKIQDSLHQFFHSVTAVVIAHRLSTIKEMDRIVVLEEGRIVEEGSFDALHDRKGRFYELWEKQKF